MNVWQYLCHRPRRPQSVAFTLGLLGISLPGPLKAREGLPRDACGKNKCVHADYRLGLVLVRPPWRVDRTTARDWYIGRVRPIEREGSMQH